MPYLLHVEQLSFTQLTCVKDKHTELQIDATTQ